MDILPADPRYFDRFLAHTKQRQHALIMNRKAIDHHLLFMKKNGLSRFKQLKMNKTNIIDRKVSRTSLLHAFTRWKGLLMNDKSIKATIFRKSRLLSMTWGALVNYIQDQKVLTIKNDSLASTHYCRARMTKAVVYLNSYNESRIKLQYFFRKSKIFRYINLLLKYFRRIQSFSRSNKLAIRRADISKHVAVYPINRYYFKRWIHYFSHNRRRKSRQPLSASQMNVLRQYFHRLQIKSNASDKVVLKYATARFYLGNKTILKHYRMLIFYLQVNGKNKLRR